MKRIPIDTIWKFIKVCTRTCRTIKVPDFFKMRNKVRSKTNCKHLHVTGPTPNDWVCNDCGYVEGKGK